MDLINLLPQRKNTVVTVNGSNYKIDGDGICHGVKDPDAAKMLRNTEAWRQWDGKTTTGSKGPTAAGKIGLIGSTGEVIHKQDTTKPDATAPLRAAQDQFEAKKRGEAAPEEPEYRVPRDGEDWPDPVDAMPIDYIRQMADAYEVKHNARTSKKDLIKKIMVEMYPKKK